MQKIIKNFFKIVLTSVFLLESVCASNVLTPELRKLLNSPDIQAIFHRGKLLVAMTKEDNIPFYMVDEKGNLIGHDVDLAKAIANTLGVKVEFKRDNASFDDVVYMVAKGEADVGISKLSLTLGRAQIVRFTKPYITLNKAVLLNRIALKKQGANQTLTQLFDNKEAPIGSVAKSSYQEFAQRMFPLAKQYNAPSWNNDIVPKVLKGEILGAFRDELVVRSTLLNVPNASLYLMAVIVQDEPDPIMMIVNQNSDVLQKWLDLFLDYYYPKQNIEDIIRKYKKYMYTHKGVK